MSLLCFQEIHFREQSNFVMKFFHMMSFYDLQVSFEKIDFILAEKPDEIFWTRLKERTCTFVGK